MSNTILDSLYKALGKVTDPDLGKSFDELGAIDNITINGNQIQVYLQLVQPIHWAAESINKACVEAASAVAPNMELEVYVSEKAAAEDGRTFLKGVKNIIAVASGKGGVGKSAVAANLAAALSLSGATVGILDGDVYGPSQPTMFGVQDGKFMAGETHDGKTIAFPMEKFGIKVASMGFVINKDEAAIVRGPMLAGYFSALFEQLEWGALDFLVFDLPPGTGDIQLTLTQKIPLTGAVIVTTPQEISLADVRRSIAMFQRVNVDILGIVENMSYFVPPDMPDKKYYIFGEGGGRKMSDEFGVTLLGEVPLDMYLRETSDGGSPLPFSKNGKVQTELFKSIAANLVKEVRKHNSDSMASPVIEI